MLRPIKTEETVSHHQNNNVKEVGTSPARSNLCTYQMWDLGSWQCLKDKSRRPPPSVYTYQVWALGSWLGVPHFSMVKSWGPLLPYSSANPFIGTRDVPVTNCSSLDLISLLKEYTAWRANDKSFVRICQCVWHNKATGLCFLQSNCKNYLDLHTTSSDLDSIPPVSSQTPPVHIITLQNSK